MVEVLRAISNDDLTTGTADGTGTFDILMRSVTNRLADEYAQGRITGADYSSVYLGSMTEVLGQSVAFLLEKDKRSIELEILELEKEKAQIAKDKALIELEIARVQLELQELNKPKIEAETRLINQNAENATVQYHVLEQQVCKLKAEYDNLIEQKAKIISETGLLNQKKATETAQINGAGVDPDSVVGKQIKLYGNQADGFLRNAEQKVAKMMLDSWGVRRSTDEGTSANTTNKLDDAHVGKAITNMFEGVSIQ